MSMQIPVAEAALHVLSSPRALAGQQVGQIGALDEGLLTLERLACDERIGILDPVDRMYIEAYVTDWVVSQKVQALKDQGRARAMADQEPEPAKAAPYVDRFGKEPWPSEAARGYGPPSGERGRHDA